MTPELTALALRALLALTGLGVLVIGANVGLGGIRTMGLQVDPGFVVEVEAEAFFDQDNHVRYLGGVFAAMGTALIAGAVAFRIKEPIAEVFATAEGIGPGVGGPVFHLPKLAQLPRLSYG